VYWWQEIQNTLRIRPVAQTKANPIANCCDKASQSKVKGNVDASQTPLPLSAVVVAVVLLVAVVVAFPLFIGSGISLSLSLVAWLLDNFLCHSALPFPVFCAFKAHAIMANDACVLVRVSQCVCVCVSALCDNNAMPTALLHSPTHPHTHTSSYNGNGDGNGSNILRR